MKRRNQFQKSFVSVSGPLPPRSLNVSKFAEARACELQSLHSVISDRLKNNFRSQQNKRRRTTSFDNRHSKNNNRRSSRKRQKLSSDKEDDNQNANNYNTQTELVLPRKIRRRIELRKNPESGFSTSGDGTKRLRTHLWHSKRFQMSKKWGFYLPLGLPGRGRGSRALLKWFRHGAVLHDASYNSAVQLEGPEDSLLSILRMVLAPSPSLHIEQLFTSTLSGLTYSSAMLHHVGAPFSRLISPVTYMWRPFDRHNINDDACSNHNISGSPSSSLRCSSFRQLWVWIHPGVLIEALGAFSVACQKQRDETGVSVNCSSLDGQLANLELIGSKSIQILQEILQPVSETRGSFSELMTNSVGGARIYPQLERSFILEQAMHLPDQAIISLVVKDPRGLPKKGVNSVSDSVLYSDSKDLWENHNRVIPPVEENLLCTEKHQKRMNFFHLYKNSESPTIETKEQPSRSCPILLLKKSNMKGACVRWVVILPLSWAKAFWLPLVNHGAHAVGLRERRWIACDVGLPSFPFDFPDCKAYSFFMAAASDEKGKLRPTAMRPLKVPIQPPWDSVRLAFETYSPNVRDCLDVRGGNLRTSFEGFVARTSSNLSSYLNEIHGGHLLLFPNEQMGEKTQLVKNRDKIIPGPEGKSHLPLDRKLCFVRVLLRAFKEGSFDDGSVICAPHRNDILLWTSRSDVDEGRLQIPQSSIGSYYKQQASGKWELQKPEDTVAREYHRLPIGYVTTGFVRGSKKPAAEAYCEATLLAELRREQWEGKKGKQRRPEIFVLVRNLRSAAYRLALATIVLEQREDVDFM